MSARVGAFLVGLIAVSVAPTVVNLVHDQPVGGLAIGAFVVGTLVMVVGIPYLAVPRGSARRLGMERSNLVAGKTVIGWRTIDLTRIRKVHYCAVGSRYTTPRSYYVVTDASGSVVWLNTDDEAAVGWLHDALVTLASTGVSVSYFARRLLGLDGRPYNRYLDCRDRGPLWAMLGAAGLSIFVWSVLIGVLA
ncbi:MAG TPA: hypothetical protein VKB69_12105 [Micromonosporaceae bacterium]|nr:hypothetical protein [Micromonosporaceae bacterium]